VIINGRTEFYSKRALYEAAPVPLYGKSDDVIRLFEVAWVTW
jgi:hypothetical protein